MPSYILITRGQSNPSSAAPCGKRAKFRKHIQLVFDAKESGTMSDVIKIIEVLAESPRSWEDAANEALKKASKTLKNIRSIYIKNFEAKVDRNKITQYRINPKISFLLD